MNIKRIYGALLMVLGIGGLVHAALSLVNSAGLSNMMALVIYGILGIIFFLAGISLVKTIR